MADEEKTPMTDQETGDEVQPTPEYTEGEAERLPEAETAVEEAVTDAVEASEAAAETPVVEAFDSAVSAVQEAVDTLEPEPHEADHAHDAHAAMLSDTTVVFGREITVQGGIYTVIFGFLAAATLIEIVLGGFEGVLLIPILLAIATVKAGLVVAYYMHLRTDTRLFTYILLMPLGLAVISMLFLLAVPPTGY